MNNQERNIVVIVDAPDPDNFAAVMMALFLFGEKVKCIIVTGRPAHPDRGASKDQYDQEFSERVLRGNTRRLKGFMGRAGHVDDVLVCEGLIPPSTLVSHKVHVDEKGKLDLHNDDGYYEGRGEDRTFDDAVELIKGLDGPIDLIVGGPLTEVAELLKIDEIKSKLGTMVCQLGLFGFGEGVTSIAGGGLTFNSAADREATAKVLGEFPGDLVMIPTDVTKRQDVRFDTTAEMSALGISGEIVQMTEIFHRFLPPGSPICPHDVHTACGMYQLHHPEQPRMYGMSEVEVTSVGPQGQLSANFDVVVTDRPKRFVVTDVDAAAFLEQYSMGCGEPTRAAG